MFRFWKSEYSEIHTKDMEEFKKFVANKIKSVPSLQYITINVTNVEQSDQTKIMFKIDQNISLGIYLTLGMSYFLPGPCVYLRATKEEDSEFVSNLVAEYRTKCHMNVGIL